MGWTTLAWCEWLEYNQKVLKHHFPKAKPHGDITKTDFTIYRGLCDILTGSFPCQPFSNSGEQKGEHDERYLFEEMLRAVREIQPRWVVAENVYTITASKFGKLFEQICSSLENEGYKVQSYIIPASAVEADHERYRVWIVAYSDGIRLQGQGKCIGQVHTKENRHRETNRFVDAFQRNALPFVCSGHDGISRELAELALHGAGNAIVPQIAYEIFKSIEQMEIILNSN